MEPKREVTSVDLRAVCAELTDYSGARVDKAYLYGQDLIRLKLRDFDHGRVELFLEVGEQKRIHATPPEYVSDAPERPPDFARMLRNRIGGSRLESVEQYEFDRIATLNFIRDDERTTLVVEFFGDGNLAVLDETGTVIDSLRTIRLKSRTVAPGAPYEFPDTRLYPFSLDRERFEAHLHESDADVVRTLATQLNLGGTYAEEVCARAEVDRELAIAEIDETTIDRLFRALSDIGERIESGQYDPVIVSADDAVVDVAPFTLAIHESHTIESFDTMNDALAEYFHRLADDGSESAQEDTGPDFAAEIAKYDRMIEQQQSAIADFEDEEEQMRTRAELLYAHYDVVDEILATVAEARDAGYDWEDIQERFDTAAAEGIEPATLVESVGNEGMVHVRLEDTIVAIDPQHGVEQNADRLYQEAKRIRDKREGAKDALEDSREAQASVIEERDTWEATPEEPADASPSDAPRDWLSMESIPIRESEEWYERFRWFRTSDGFLVIGGRNADQNEELVKKYVEPGDRFIHAQAHGGPVTILKATAPSEAAREVEFPDQTIQEAAQFAISYSSVWKAGQFAGEAYHVRPDQVSKEAESGEYLEKGAFVVRGDRTYLDNIPVGVAVGIQCEPNTRVIGGPPSAITDQAAASITVEPGDIAQNDVAKRLYRNFREQFTDTSFVRNVASPDRIQAFLPPGQSRIVE